jgi:hypothetical protein
MMEQSFPGMNEMAAMSSMILILIAIIAMLISSVLTVVVWCKLFGKSGHSWGLGFLMLVPIANLILPLYLAFSDWPVLKKLREYENNT